MHELPTGDPCFLSCQGDKVLREQAYLQKAARGHLRGQRRCETHGLLASPQPLQRSAIGLCLPCSLKDTHQFEASGC